MDVKYEHAGVEIDMDDIPMELTRERALGLQEDLRDRLAAEDFQERLRECERTHKKGSLEFRRDHQSLVLEVQSQVLPAWGFKGSLEGVHDMLEAFEAFKSDAEITRNIEEIDSLIWKPFEHHDAPHHEAPKLSWHEMARRPVQKLSPAEGKLLPEDALHPADLPVSQAPGVEIDMTALSPVPLTRGRLLGLQEELKENLGSHWFQKRLRDCKHANGEDTAAFRREHQQLVLEVQAEVLPKYGFEGSLQGVHDLLEAIKASFSEDAEVSANIAAIDALIWS